MFMRHCRLSLSFFSCSRVYMLAIRCCSRQCGLPFCMRRCEHCSLVFYVVVLLHGTAKWSHVCGLQLSYIYFCYYVPGTDRVGLNPPFNVPQVSLLYWSTGLKGLIIILLLQFYLLFVLFCYMGCIVFYILYQTHNYTDCSIFFIAIQAYHLYIMLKIHNYYYIFLLHCTIKD